MAVASIVSSSASPCKYAATISRREKRKSRIRSHLNTRILSSAAFIIWVFSCSLIATTRSSVSLAKVTNSSVFDAVLETFNSNFNRADVGIRSALFLSLIT